MSANQFVLNTFLLSDKSHPGDIVTHLKNENQSSLSQIIVKHWKMCGASEFKRGWQQQGCLFLRWINLQNSGGIEQTFTLIINQPLASPAQIAHSRLHPFLFFFFLSVAFSRPRLPTAKYFGSSKVNLLWINNHHNKGGNLDRGLEMFFSNTKNVLSTFIRHESRPNLLHSFTWVKT